MTTKILNIRRGNDKGIAEISESKVYVKIVAANHLVYLSGKITEENTVEQLLKNMEVEIII